MGNAGSGMKLSGCSLYKQPSRLVTANLVKFKPCQSPARTISSSSSSVTVVEPTRKLLKSSFYFFSFDESILNSSDVQIEPIASIKLFPQRHDRIPFLFRLPLEDDPSSCASQIDQQFHPSLSTVNIEFLSHQREIQLARGNF